MGCRHQHGRRQGPRQTSAAVGQRQIGHRGRRRRRARPRRTAPDPQRHITGRRRGALGRTSVRDRARPRARYSGLVERGHTLADLPTVEAGRAKPSMAPAPRGATRPIIQRHHRDRGRRKRRGKNRGFPEADERAYRTYPRVHGRRVAADRKGAFAHVAGGSMDWIDSPSSLFGYLQSRAGIVEWKGARDSRPKRKPTANCKGNRRPLSPWNRSPTGHRSRIITTLARFQPPATAAP